MPTTISLIVDGYQWQIDILSTTDTREGVKYWDVQVPTQHSVKTGAASGDYFRLEERAITGFQMRGEATEDQMSAMVKGKIKEQLAQSSERQ